MESSLRLTRETAIPATPARAVLPILWKYVRGSSGRSKLITWLTFVMSRPLAATSVATRTATDPSRKPALPYLFDPGKDPHESLTHCSPRLLGLEQADRL